MERSLYWSDRYLHKEEVNKNLHNNINYYDYYPLLLNEGRKEDTCTCFCRIMCNGPWKGNQYE